MAGKDWGVLSGHFEDGSKVGVFERTGDFWPGRAALGSPVATSKVESGSSHVTFRGLENGRYWAASTGKDDPDRGVAFTVKDVPAARKRQAAASRGNPQAVPASRHQEIVTGATGTRWMGRVVHTPVEKGVEPHPSLNQASVSEGTQQRSATPLGQATPTDPDEPQPHPTQESVRKGTWQRSDTGAGEAEPVGDGVQRQEDFEGPQRSDTERGEATPIGSGQPRGTDVNPDSRERAVGDRPTDEGEATRTARKPRSRAKK
jgi:hypothetical protein